MEGNTGFAMQLTDDVNWGVFDFVVSAGMLLGASVVYGLAVKKTGSLAYRAAVGVAVAAAFLLVWINLAVGIIGSEDNPANLMFGAVLVLGIVGAVAGRFQPSRMARVLSITALAQVSVGVIALVAGLGSTAPSFPAAIVFPTGFFAALWLLSAYLFEQASRQTSHPAAGQPT